MSTQIKDLRLPVNIHQSVHPVLHEAISATPDRFKSERMRVLAEKGLMYERLVTGVQSPSAVGVPVVNNSQSEQAEATEIKF